MATYILGVLVGAALLLAARHIYRNFTNDTHDCCGVATNCAKCPHCCK